MEGILLSIKFEYSKISKENNKLFIFRHDYLAISGARHCSKRYLIILFKLSRGHIEFIMPHAINSFSAHYESLVII